MEPLHRPFGALIDRIFARRLGQLRMPLAPLDTSRGVTSELLGWRAGDGERLTAWVRRRLPTSSCATGRRRGSLRIWGRPFLRLHYAMRRA